MRIKINSAQPNKVPELVTDIGMGLIHGKQSKYKLIDKLYIYIYIYLATGCDLVINTNKIILSYLWYKHIK